MEPWAEEILNELCIRVESDLEFARDVEEQVHLIVVKHAIIAMAQVQ